MLTILAATVLYLLYMVAIHKRRQQVRTEVALAKRRRQQHG